MATATTTGPQSTFILLGYSSNISREMDVSGLLREEGFLMLQNRSMAKYCRMEKEFLAKL
ncbi:hypothetical protein Leryth_004197 [Lithospermum erythrorhizon]|nr:hypothetical protein Leryth_004197 [Lithospermum erythrorhizon]